MAADPVNGTVSGTRNRVNPRLVAVSGPLRDSVFVLPTEELSLGRDASNGLPISDPSVSRRHCLIHREGGGFKVRDLDSRNGTLVNGEAVTDHWLHHLDEIAVGDSVFRFLIEDDSTSGSSRIVEFEDEKTTHATAEIRPQDVLYLQPDRILSELPATSRLARNLNALLKISRVVHSIRDLDDLQAQILDLIFDVAPAERGAILLDGTNGREFNSVFARNRDPGSERPVRVSRTIAQRVLEQGLAILGSDVPGSSGLGAVESLIASQVRSLLCVPLTIYQRTIGCIYLDTINIADRFNEDHLQLVTAIAGISAVALENARRLQWLEHENRRLMTEITLDRTLVGESARMKEVFKFLARVAPTDATVLIGGESGTGKELAARAVHRKSPRANKPFVAINCAAIPENLLESELFGYEKGAFTGAVSQKKGRLEVADGGVLFLDEIGELAPSLQVKLLRVLQEREFERVGGNRPIHVDIRLIAATNRDLEEAVRKGEFRQDLYFRLNVVSLTMPPLREHKDDIPMLVSFLVEKHCKKCGAKPKPLSREALACLVNYDWPGNVRELENVIERALVLGSSEDILPEDLPENLLERDPAPGVSEAKYHAAVKDLKKRLIQNALEEARGNYTEAAKALGVHPNYLHRLIRNLDLKESVKANGARGPLPKQGARL
jgi:transcriptional regulator with GAF, ATPase, and Fis domain/pSer/pThr/pTyr-binding forkhead associated (FHA) protein